MYRSILIPVDLGVGETWKKALPVAVRLAQDWKAELHILTVVPDFGFPLVGSYFPEGFEKKALAHSKEALDKLLENEVPAEIKAKGHIANGSIYKEILEAANRLKSDLIILASHRPEMTDYLLGPNAARVARHANQSVMIVRD